MDRLRITIPTFLSLSRILLVIPIAILLVKGGADGRTWVLLLMAVAIATDFLDGFLARKLHQVSDVGKIADPLADKIAIAVIVAALVAAGDVPLWFGVAVVARDVLIFLGGVLIGLRKNIVPQSNWPGKIAVSVIAVYLILSTARVSSLEQFRGVTLWLSVAMMLFSTLNYAQRLFIGRRAEA